MINLLNIARSIHYSVDLTEFLGFKLNSDKNRFSKLLQINKGQTGELIMKMLFCT